MSMGSATPGAPPIAAPDVGTGGTSMVGPQTMYPSNPTPDEQAAWGSVDNAVGSTTSKFIQMLGKTPEERQANAKLFADTLEKVNAGIGNMTKSTLGQRMAEEKMRLDRQKIIQENAGRSPMTDPWQLDDQTIQQLFGQNTASAIAGIGARRWGR